MTSYRQVLDRLEASGELDPEQAEATRSMLADRLARPDRSRLINAVAAIGAWIASIFVIGFLLAMSADLFGDSGLLVYTVLFGAVAIGLGRCDTDSVFLHQISLALSAAAQIIVPVALLDLGEAPTIVVQALVSSVLYAALPDRANRVISAVVALGVITGVGSSLSAVIFYAMFGIVFALVASVFALDDDLDWKARRVLRPLAYVGALGLLLMSIEVLLGELPELFGGDVHASWVVRGIAALFALGVVALKLADEDADRRPALLAAVGLIVSLGLATSAGIFVSLLVAALGFWKLDRMLIVMGGLGLAGHLGFYYYDLDITLLQKSGVLVLSGLVLLGVRWWFGRRRAGEAA
ncbi:MAG: DUF4401 domain-containing protein [Myxococcota bacterium]